MSDIVPIPARIYENTVQTLKAQTEEIARLQAVVDAAVEHLSFCNDMPITSPTVEALRTAVLAYYKGNPGAANEMLWDKAIKNMMKRGKP